MLRVRPVQVLLAPVRAASSGQAASARIESRLLRRVNGYARTISDQDAEVAFRTRLLLGDPPEISDEWFELFDKPAER
jgi:hypothetical protein